MIFLIHILSTRVELFFSIQNLENFSSNPGKVHFEGLVHLFRYIGDINNLGLKYVTKIQDAPIYVLLIQASINTENQLIVFYDSKWKYCLDTDRSTGAYIVFYQGGPINHCTHVLGPVAK